MIENLGRGLISTQPNAYGCELNEGQMIGCQLVISCRDTPTLLDLVEEPFDQVARAVQYGLKQMGLCDCASLSGCSIEARSPVPLLRFS
jgi:hypothetical protein